MDDTSEQKDEQAIDAEPGHPSDSESKHKLPVTLSVLAFFVSYVLSAGPAVFITRRFDQQSVTTIVECLYAPIILIVRLNIPVISPAIQAYVRLFR